MHITNTDELELIEKYRNGYRGVFWHTEDFEHRAKINEDIAGIELFDRTKFAEALENMLHTHNANFGINWTTVDVCLETYCKLPEDYPRQLKAKL